MKSQNIQSLLQSVACSCPERGLIIYRPGESSKALPFSYAQLLDKAYKYATTLKQAHGFRRRTPVSIYLEDQLDALLCFWATLFADLIPVLVPRMSNIEEQRYKYVQSLDTLLHHPIWICSSKTLCEIPPDLGVNLLELDTITSGFEGPISRGPNSWTEQSFLASADEDAMFMLTSGSTGAPKAVRLSHHQLLTSIRGKLSMRDHPIGKPFLNWISLDHVASIVEIHLTAIIHQVDQVLVRAIDVISDPLLFIKLLSEHKVSRTFAPNFFLAKLLQSIKARPEEVAADDIDLRHLMWLGSGGEANDVEVGVELSDFICKRGSRADVLVPGFGMTETCAGSIYNMNCPSYDLQRGNAYTALGTCIPGIEMRIVPSLTDDGDERTTTNTAGDLEVHGDVVFKGYYNNISATEEAFTPDGWFRTGDQAVIDADGILNLTGRVKDTVIINGVKFFPQDIENMVTQALTEQPSRTICFPFRLPSAPTESICILYVLDKDRQTPELLVEFDEKIKQVVLMHTGAISQVIALPDESKLQVSSLGKVSRNKLRTLYQNGFYKDSVDEQRTAIEQYQSRLFVEEVDENVTALLLDIHTVLQLPIGTVGPDVAIFEVGMNSIDIFRLKHCIEQRLAIDLPLTVILANPTARALAPALEALNRAPSTEYDPVVTLRREGSLAPLWLVHPGVGEVLVFLGLSKHITDRPVYALRARGFDGQSHFKSISETVATYCDAIKKQQPEGPYAIAGYSYGSMLAFEICKQFEAGGDEVRFLGSFNLPPHIKQRMKQMDWKQCFIHLCFFLDLISQDQIDQISSELQESTNDQAFDHIFRLVHKERLQILSLDSMRLKRWTEIAYGLQSMAVEYEPSGTVSGIDVFHAEPLKVAARSRSEWVDQHLSKWSSFSNSEPRFHQVGGAHYTMLAPEYIDGFATTLKGALRDRDV